MLVMLFRSVLSSSVQMFFPLATVLLLVPISRKHIQPHTLFNIEKLMVIGMLLALGFTILGPLVRISAPNRTPILQTSPILPVSPDPLTILIETAGEELALPTAASTLSIWDVGGILWLCGAVALFLLTLTQNVLFFCHVRKNSFPSPLYLSEAQVFCIHIIELQVTPTVRISSEISSPMAAGYFHPVIFLPVNVLFLSPKEQQLLLSHELYHCKTKDNFWRLLSSVVLAVYWFNPFVWVLSRSFSTQCELCCDENVLLGASAQTRKLYGKLLLALSSKKADHSQPILSLQSGWRDTFYSLKLRIEQIVSSKHKHTGIIFLSGCVLILFLFSGMVGFHQVYAYSPSDIIILSDNPMGYTKEGTPAVRETHIVKPPIDTKRVLHFTLPNADGSIRKTQLHFMANTENEFVTAGCNGVVVATQTMNPNEVNKLQSMLGSYVIVDCGNGISIRYTYLNTVLVDVGQTVSTGDILGTAGHTGASYGESDQCGVFVMQDGLMVDPLLFFDDPTKPILSFDASVDPSMYS